MSIWEIALGCLIGSSATILFFYFQKPPAPQIVKDEEEVKKLRQQLAQIPGEFEPLQKKLKEALERKESYKKLAEVHRQEIERLKNESARFAEENLAKGRRIAELEIYLEDPAALSHPDKELEFLYKQIKQQFEEKNHAYEEMRTAFIEAENKLAVMQKEMQESYPAVDYSEQLHTLEEEKQRLEELVTQLSAKPAKKKTASRVGSKSRGRSA